MLHFQLVEGVQRRHFVTLGKRRIIKDGAQEIVQITSKIEYGLPDVDELRRSGSDRVDAQEAPILPVKEELYQSAVIAQNLSPRDFPVAGDSVWITREPDRQSE